MGEVIAALKRKNPKAAKYMTAISAIVAESALSSELSFPTPVIIPALTARVFKRICS
jgi:hypothetical protein